MFEDVQGFFFVAAVAVAVYWILPGRLVALRAWWLISVSALLVFRVSPPALATAVALSLVTWATARALLRRRSLTVLWAGIATLVGVVTLQKQLGHPGDYVALGLSFVMLKSIMVLVGVHRGRLGHDGIAFREVGLLNLYFPIYSGGPIQRPEGLMGAAPAARFDPNEFFYGLGRIAVGLFKAEFLAAAFLGAWSENAWVEITKRPEAFSAGQIYGYMMLRFLVGYLGFSGYTDIAVGLGRTMGLTIMENFRYPLVAENMQEFWQRWHLSLGSFVNRYLFIPLARRSGGRINLALLASFLLVGLWHEVSLTYLLWGAGHGAALVAVAELGRFMKRRPAWDRWRYTPPYRVAAVVATVTWVSWLSALGNSGSFAAGWAITRRLLGL